MDTKLTYKFLSAKEKPPVCKTCGTMLTVKHVVIECHRYKQNRINLSMPESLDDILGPNPEQKKKS